MNYFQCSECGSSIYHDIEGSGCDEHGEFTEYWCNDCNSRVRIYDEE